MKKIKEIFKSNIKIVIAFILGLIISGTSVYAATILYNANQVGYDNTSSGLTSTDVQGALDELYQKASKLKTYERKIKIYETLLQDQNFITLTVNGSGPHAILGANADLSNVKNVFIDGVKQNVIRNSYNFAGEGEHIVALAINDGINSLANFFYGCGDIASIDLSHLDASNVSAMNGMFYGCSSLTSLDLSNLDTSTVIGMNNMFYGCSSLTSLDLSNVDTSQVLDMNNMFYGCSSLTSLDLSNLDTSTVIDMNNMFSGTPSNLKIKINCSKSENLANAAGSKAVCVN